MFFIWYKLCFALNLFSEEIASSQVEETSYTRWCTTIVAQAPLYELFHPYSWCRHCFRFRALGLVVLIPSSIPSAIRNIFYKSFAKHLVRCRFQP